MPPVLQPMPYIEGQFGDGNGKPRCFRCRLGHTNEEPCDRFMNEFDLRVMLDQLRDLPPLASGGHKVRVAETFLRDRLRRVGEMKRGVVGS
jgi:hypothetical protein